jgi:sugar phosphate permease
MLGSMVYLGQVLGSLLATCLLQIKNLKVFLCSSLLLNIIFLVTFTTTENVMLMSVCRVLTGLFQVQLWIYFPVWADFFGNEEQKAAWLSVLIVSPVIGNISGYILSACI